MERLVGNVTEVNRAIDRVLRIFAWVLPALAIGYGALILLGLVAGVSVSIPWVYYTLSFILVAMAIIQQMMPVTKRSGTITYLVIYHICVAVGMFFVYGMNTPMMLLWGILSLITVIYYGIFACTLSLGALAVVFLVYKYTIGFLASWFSINLITCFLFLTAIAVIYGYLQAETYRKQASLVKARNDERAQHHALLTTINSTSQAMFTLSPTGRVVLYNAAFLTLLDTNTLPKRPYISKIMPLKNEDGTPFDYVKTLQTNRFSSDDLVFAVNEDDHMNIRLDINRVSDDSTQKGAHFQQFVCTARDITKEKSLEEERDEFISVVSHELRTPITITEGVLDNAKLIIERDPKKITAVKDSLETAHHQVVFLAKMVNDLSTLSRAERGLGDEKENIDIAALAHQLYQEYVMEAEKKNLAFNLAMAGTVGTAHASRLYLQELLQNFITNAIKYTKEGTITLSISMKDDRIHFAVEDTGIGIARSDQKHIFEKFYRSEDYRTRETGGTGLGLYVSLKLANKLGTTIDVTSRLNHGSTFSFSLPQATTRRSSNKSGS